MNCSLEVFVLSLMYIEKFCAHHLKLVNVYSIKQVVLASYCFLLAFTPRVIVAQKFHDESCYKNDFYASMDFLTPAEVSDLEENFLRCINYSLYIPFTKYTQFYNKLRVVLSSSVFAKRCSFFSTLFLEGNYLPPLAIHKDEQGLSLCYLPTSCDAAHCAHYSQQKHFCNQFAVPMPMAMAPIPMYPIKALSPIPFYQSDRNAADDYAPYCVDSSSQWSSPSSSTTPNSSSKGWHACPQSNHISCYCVPFQPLLPSICIPIIPSIYPFPIAANSCTPLCYTEKYTAST